MPRVISSLATAHKDQRGKENVAPHSSARAGPSSSSSAASRKATRVPQMEPARSSRDDIDELSDHDSPRSSYKRSADSDLRSSSSRAGSRAKERNGSSSSGVGKARRVEQREATETTGQDSLLTLTQRERDEIQLQFDELQELRMTEPERMLADWKRTNEEHSSTTDEYIATLKEQIAELQDDAARRSNPRDDAQVDSLKRQVQESERRETKLEKEVERLQSQLKGIRDEGAKRQPGNAATSRLALQSRLGSGALGAGDERAVRRLYEDLTGLVVNKVEAADASSKSTSDHRRFHAILACAGYHDLEIKLEESTSSAAAGGAPRDDFVYTPVLDADRDAELLQSGRLPDYLRESIRFERATAVKFLTTLHKRLDRNAKR